MKFLCPEGLNTKKLLLENPPCIKGRKLKEENLLFIIDLLCTLPFRRPDLVTDDGYVKLSSSLLNQKITRYQEYLLYLIKSCVIEKDGSFVAGNIASNENPAKCLGYRFCKEYRTGKREIEVQNKKLIKLKEGLYKLTNRQKTEYRHLLKWFDDRLRIDIEAALDYNQKKYAEIKNDITKWEFKKIKHPIYGEVNSPEKRDPHYAYEAGNYAIKAFAGKQYDFSIGDSTKRFFSSFNGLKRDFRQFITYDGHRITELDLANCQPYLFLVVLNPKFWNDEHDYFNNKDIHHHHLTRRFKKALDPYLSSLSYMLVKSAESGYNKGFHEYQDIVSKGMFYDTFYNDHILSFEPDGLTNDLVYDVTELKNGYLKYLNSSYRHSCAIQKGVRMDFPIVDRVLTLLKRSDWEYKEKMNRTNPDFKKANGVSKLLMSIESTIFLLRIAKRISIEMPKVPLFSVHDCIATIDKEKDSVKKIMEEEFEKCIGVKPFIKEENWLPKNK